MDDKEKIRKAYEILERHNVGKNLTFLIEDAWKHGVRGVDWDLSVKASSIPNCYKFCSFRYGGRRFQISAMNKRTTDDGDEDWSDLILKVDDEIVLMTILSTPSGGGRTINRVDIGASLRQVKLGDWMKVLDVVCQRSREAWAELNKRKEQDAKLASEIDLGEYE